jgi:hypothetical protein
MPSSDAWLIPHVIDIARRVRPSRVLDVGVGSGKYGFLLRDYLEVWEGRYGREDWETRIEGIEVHREYANPNWENVYDEVHLANVEDWLEGPAPEPYDLTLFCDVIEHFEKEAGGRVLEGLLDRSRYLIVTTPLKHHEQGALLGNPYEVHRSTWTRSDFARFHPLFRKTHFCLVAFLSKEAIPDDLRYRIVGPWGRRWMRLRGYRKPPGTSR